MGLHRLTIAALAFAALAAGGAEAQTCTSSSATHLNTDGEKVFKINTGSFAAAGIGTADARAAVLLGASVWNEQANGGYFRLDGETTDTYATYFGLSAAQCAALGLNHSLVWVEDATQTWSGLARAVCDGEQFVITLATKKTSGTINWSVGSLSGSDPKDVAGCMAHEFGHVIGLGHTTNSDYAVMEENCTTNTLNKREAYRWDVKCSRDISGSRSLAGRRRFHTSGSMGSEWTWTGSWDVSKLSAGVTWNGGSANWAAAVVRDDCLAWTEVFSTSNTQCTGAGVHIIGVTEATWRDRDISMDRLFYVDYLEYPVTYASSAKHRLRYRRSNDGFTSQEISGSMSYCTSMSGWLSCPSSNTALYTGKPVAVAWHEPLDKTIMAWTNQDRLDGSASNLVYVSVSNIGNTLLPQPDSLGYRSSVAPAVACADTAGGAGGTYDCVLAFVDEADTRSKVKVRRFYIYSSSSRYHVKWDGTVRSIDAGSWLGRSASRLALWFSSGDFYLSFRPSSYQYDQDLVVYESSDGASWTRTHWALAESPVGPTAAPVLVTPNNALLYAR